MKKVFANRMTIDQIKADDARKYNPSAWEKRIEDYAKYSNVEFFKVPKDDVHEYDRFYAVYTLPEGLRVLNQVSYSSGLSSGGFFQTFIMEGDFDSDTYTKYEDGKVAIMTKGFGMDNLPLNNSKEARFFMIGQSTKWGSVYTKESL